MWSVFVVLDHPPICRFANVVESGEEVLVENLLAVGSVKAFDKGVLVGFAGLDVLDRHASALGPTGEDLPEKFGPIVQT